METGIRTGCRDKDTSGQLRRLAGEMQSDSWVRTHGYSSGTTEKAALPACTPNPVFKPLSRVLTLHLDKFKENASVVVF